MYIYLPYKKLYTKLTYHDHFDKNVEQLDLKITRMSKEGVALFCGCATQFYFVIVYVDKVDCICLTCHWYYPSSWDVFWYHSRGWIFSCCSPSSMESSASRTDSQGVGEGLGMLQAHAVTLLNMMSLYSHFVVFFFFPPFSSFCVSMCVFNVYSSWSSYSIFVQVY